MSTKTIFVWRENQQSYGNRSNLDRCPMCATPLFIQAAHREHPERLPASDGPEYVDTEARKCPLCGWRYAWEYDTLGYMNTPASYVIVSELRNLELNSAELRVAELATHLRSHAEDMYDLSPRRFEALVTSLLTDRGFHALHTGRSGDGGADIVIFQESTRFGIVECKRYSSRRKVGVSILRSLVGAAVNWDVRSIYLATTSSFTAGVFATAESYGIKGYQVDLIDGSRLLTMFDAYDESLPRLEHLTPHARQEIIENNLRLWSAG